MNKYLSLLICLFTGSALAGYKGQDPSEMHRFVAPNNDLYMMYDSQPTTQQALKEPLCHGRNMAIRELPDKRYELACWWKVGEMYFAYSTIKGLIGMNPDFVLNNDNYVKDRSNWTSM